MSASQPAPSASPLRRRLGLAAALVLAAALLVWLALVWFSFAGRFMLLRVGLTKDEVYSRLGPPGDYVPPNARWATFMIVGPVFHQPEVRSVDVWRTDYGDYYVGYDAAQRLIARRHNPCRQPPSVMERLGDWWSRLVAVRPPAAAPTMAIALPAGSVSQ
jgi:hypothetical protein